MRDGQTLLARATRFIAGGPPGAPGIDPRHPETPGLPFSPAPATRWPPVTFRNCLRLMRYFPIEDVLCFARIPLDMTVLRPPQPLTLAVTRPAPGLPFGPAPATRQ